MKTRHRLFRPLLLACLLLLGGCIEITEIITVNPDGSGRMSLTIDMGSLASAMNSQNTGFDVSIIEKIKKGFSGAEAKLSGLEGISNIRVKVDEKIGYYSLGFDFRRSKNLNQAVYKLLDVEKSALYPSIYKISGHKFRKKNIAPLISQAFKDKKSSALNDMLYEMVNYHCSYVFPAEVKKSTNIRATYPDKQTVDSRFTLRELIKAEFDAGHVITW
jgi:hypothetical protein